MITSSSGGHGLVFPKVTRTPSLCSNHSEVTPVPGIATELLQGGWESDETVEAAAARETVEEAGVRGRIEVSNKCRPLPCVFCKSG